MRCASRPPSPLCRESAEVAAAHRRIRAAPPLSAAAHLRGARGEERVTFPGDGFQGVKKLCIRGSLRSVTFESGALPDVQVLQLKFEKDLDDKSSGVSGIKLLSSLKHVYLEFIQQDAGAIATTDAMRKAAEAQNHPEITVMANGQELLKTAWSSG